MLWKLEVVVNWLSSRIFTTIFIFNDTMNNVFDIDCLDACNWTNDHECKNITLSKLANQTILNKADSLM